MGFQAVAVALLFASAALSQAIPGTRAGGEYAEHTPATSAAEIGEISTDRPDFTESTDVVGGGMIQFENGLTLSSEGGTKGLTTGELLMRVGLSNRLELRFGADGFLAEWAPEGVGRRGFSDLEFGAKIKVLEQTHYLPSLSVIPILSAPSGTDFFSSHGYDPTLKLAWARDLPRGFGLSGNVNVSSLTSPEGRFTQWAYSFSLGHALPAGLQAYAELFGFSPWDQGEPAAWIANSGISRKLGRNAQLDARVGRRITAAGPDWFFGFGVALRRPFGPM